MRDDEEKGGFLARWSRRKEAARQGRVAAETPTPDGEVVDEALAPRGEGNQPGGEAGAMASAEPEQRAEPASTARVELTEADFADVDFSALNSSSDFTRFLGPRVPEAIRQRALARLWQTDPAFSTADVLHDYAEDFTDAAKAVPGIASSWKFGRGYLSDEEVAAWEALGKPPAEAEAAAGEKKGGEQVAEAESEAPAGPPADPSETTKVVSPQSDADRAGEHPVDEATPDCGAVAADPTALPRDGNGKA